MLRIILIILAGLTFSGSKLTVIADEIGDNSSNGTILSINDAQAKLVQNTNIAAPIAGNLLRLDVQPGDQIEPGSTLLILDASLAKRELEAAQAAYEAAALQAENQVSVRYAQRTSEVKRRELQQSKEANSRYEGSVTATEIDRLQLLIDQADLSIQQAEHELHVAAATAEEKRAICRLSDERVQQHTIDTPIAGSVAETLVQVGQWVEPGQPLVRLISLDPIQVSCFVDGNRWDRSLIGHPVTFEFKAPRGVQDELELDASVEAPAPVSLSGRVSFVSEELNPVTSQIRLDAEINNPNGRLRPGVRGRLLIQRK